MHAPCDAEQACAHSSALRMRSDKKRSKEISGKGKESIRFARRIVYMQKDLVAHGQIKRTDVVFHGLPYRLRQKAVRSPRRVHPQADYGIGILFHERAQHILLRDEAYREIL